MRTLIDATLYTVKGPRGSYCAIRNHDTGAVLTERTESAAASLANEQDLVIVDQRAISHAELLEMMATRCANGALPVRANAEVPPPCGAEHGSGLMESARRILHH